SLKILYQEKEPPGVIFEFDVFLREPELHAAADVLKGIASGLDQDILRGGYILDEAFFQILRTAYPNGMTRGFWGKIINPSYWRFGAEPKDLPGNALKDYGELLAARQNQLFQYSGFAACPGFEFVRGFFDRFKGDDEGMNEYGIVAADKDLVTTVGLE